jgi:pimeloyl-ACP methyl ester carboxylesterase
MRLVRVPPRPLIRAWILAVLCAPVAWPQDLTGNWQGTLDVGPNQLRLGLHVSRNDAGAYSSVLDSIDQGTTGMPVRVTLVQGRELHLELPDLSATFDGSLNAGQDEIAGLFTQRGITLPLALRRVEKIETLVRAQQPQPPFPYDSEEVTYENPAAGVKLAGTLTRPRGDGPFPAALLISGSGAQDRDATLFGHKPFLILADALTRRGLAVLRVDARGVGKSTGSSTQATLDDLSGDAEAGVEYLKSRPDVDAKRVGLIGHSEGGIVGPLVASRSAGIAFLVLLAGPSVTGEQVSYKQAELFALAAGASPDAITQQRNWQQTVFRILKTEPDTKAAVEKINAAWNRMNAALPAAQRAATTGEEAQAVKAEIDAQIASVTTPEVRSMLFHDPAETLRKVKAPVLALYGSGDLQVSAEQNLPPAAAALASGGNEDFTVSVLPGLNHLFQTCVVCIPTEYGTISETISPTVLELIGDWIVRHTQAK